MMLEISELIYSIILFVYVVEELSHRNITVVGLKEFYFDVIVRQ